MLMWQCVKETTIWILFLNAERSLGTGKRLCRLDNIQHFGNQCRVGREREGGKKWCD